MICITQILGQQCRFEADSDVPRLTALTVAMRCDKYDSFLGYFFRFLIWLRLILFFPSSVLFEASEPISISIQEDEQNSNAYLIGPLFDRGLCAEGYAREGRSMKDNLLKHSFL